MQQVLDFIGRHGGPVIFFSVFLDQLGLPVATIPLLLALGALVGTGRIHPVLGLLLATGACLCADLIWFQLGRWKGSRILGLLCRVALEPDSCVSKTRDLFARHGVKSLLVAKFVPGFETVAPPLAGLLGVGAIPFVLWSTGGALLWLLTYGGLGYLFSDRLEELAPIAKQFQGTLVVAVVGLSALYVAWKYLARRRVLRSIRMTRITPDELYQMIVSGQPPTIIDARSKSALDALPFVIEGARRLIPEEIDERHLEIPRDREVVVYCSCPNELSSARLALKLKRLGIQQVRPLTGGIEEWRARRLPLVAE
jgi:membrane protein DedA with SNARE-associated domain/rhodanese-related sulfurtransferase